MGGGGGSLVSEGEEEEEERGGGEEKEEELGSGPRIKWSLRKRRLLLCFLFFLSLFFVLFCFLPFYKLLH